jgi:uncharacterized membrane protein
MIAALEPLAAPLGALDIVRTAIALAVFLFLPGWLFATAWLEKQKKALAAVELITVSVFASVVFLSLIVCALAFTVGANLFTVLGCELVLIGGLWLWKRKR